MPYPPFELVELDPAFESVAGMSTTPRCASIPAVKDVTRPADDPRPVLFVWCIGRGRGENGVRDSSEEYKGGRDNSAS
jgi:hypothetical protein